MSLAKNVSFSLKTCLNFRLGGFKALQANEPLPRRQKNHLNGLDESEIKSLERTLVNASMLPNQDPEPQNRTFIEGVKKPYSNGASKNVSFNVLTLIHNDDKEDEHGLTKDGTILVDQDWFDKSLSSDDFSISNKTPSLWYKSEGIPLTGDLSDKD